MVKNEKLKRRVDFNNGFDFIAQPTKKHGAEYGRHGMEMRFYVTGRRGVVQFIMYTHWLPMIQKSPGLWEFTYEGMISKPMAVDIGYHSPKPKWKGHNPLRKECELLKGKPCYYDGSSLNADRYMAILFNKGGDALWEKMEDYYYDTFYE